MNKIEQIHYSSISKEYLNSFDEGGHTEMDCEKAASKSSEITKQIAIEFCAYCFENQEELKHLDSYQKRFNEFLKTKQ